MEEHKTKKQLVSEIAELKALVSKLANSQKADAELSVRDISQDALNKLFLISHEITSTTELKQLYRKIISISKDLLSFDFISFLILSEDGSRLILHDTIGFPQSIIGTFSLVEGQGLASYVLRTRKPDAVLDFLTETRFEVPAIVNEYKVSSALSVPMSYGDKTFGVLIGHTLERRFFTEKEFTLFHNIGNLAAVAVKNALHLEALKESEARYRDIFENSNDLIQSFAPDGRFLHVNSAWEKTLGYTEAEARTMSVFDIIHPECKGHCIQLFQDILKGELLHRVETTFLSKSGMPIIVEGSVHCGFRDGQPIATRGIFRDVTERKNLEDEILYQATHDLLTGLPNRTLFMEHLNWALLNADRNGNMLAVLFLDLDAFKQVNDSYGHNTGDKLLKSAARRLRSCLRKSDVVCRIGGDEFIIVLPDLSSKTDAVHVVQKILTAADEEHEVDKHKLCVTYSIGVSLYPVDAADAENLVTMADRAMYNAKTSGRNGYKFYNDAMFLQA